MAGSAGAPGGPWATPGERSEPPALARQRREELAPGERWHESPPSSFCLSASHGEESL